jgi:predicted dithiol-disulfide oxidoreductase (DUF899 family)
MKTATKSTVSTLPSHPVVSHDDWLAARIDLLKREKELTHLREKIARERRALPWEAMTKEYVFDGPAGPAGLGDLFDGCSQLIVYHFMFGAGWEEGCKACSFIADHMEPSFVHLRARDVSLVAVSHAPLAEIQPFQRRMGWTFPWVSSAGNDFNRDFHVSFTPEEIASGSVAYNYTLRPFPIEEAPGLSVFARRPDGTLFHTYSRFGRGLEDLMGAYTYLDFVPKGRDEDHLESAMEWLRFHDRYETAPSALAEAR